MDRSAILHTQANHGDGIAEGLRGQRAVAAEDYERLPWLLGDPDIQGVDGDSRSGHRQIKTTRSDGATTYQAVWEVRGKHSTLALQSFRIGQKKGA